MGTVFRQPRQRERHNMRAVVILSMMIVANFSTAVAAPSSPSPIKIDDDGAPSISTEVDGGRLKVELHFHLNGTTKDSGDDYGDDYQSTVCMENGIDYYGFDTDSTTSSNAGKCMQACKESSVCSFWTFNKNTNNCIFKSSDEDRRPKDYAISGPKLCPAIRWSGLRGAIWSDAQCANVGNPGNYLFTLAQCKAACEVHPTCTAINYASSGEYLRDCVLRNCPLPVIAPSYWQNGYHGYHVLGGTGSIPR